MFTWNSEKNKKIKEDRGISFEEIVFYISSGAVLDIIENPDNERYKDQYMFIIDIENYAYIVPFVEDNENGTVFLKTIYPSRKATKKYLEEE